MSRSLALLAAGALALVLTGCSAKSVDVGVTGAQLVPGTGNLYRFCDGPTLVYFTNYASMEDQYEFVIYDGCSTDPDAEPRVAGE